MHMMRNMKDMIQKQRMTAKDIMMTTMKKVLLGILLGAAIAFPLGANYGRNAPWLSNPFAERRLGDTVKVKAELAGVRSDSIQVELSGDGRHLSIRGVREDERTEAVDRILFHQMEIYLGPFERVLALPPGARLVPSRPMADLQAQIEELWERRTELTPADHDALAVVREAVALLDCGEARVAEVEPVATAAPGPRAGPARQPLHAHHTPILPRRPGEPAS